jgi:hypothetical protein
VTAGLRRRLQRLEHQHQPAGGRVRCVWWRRGDPLPEAAPGERLLVHRWADHAGDLPAPLPPEAVG